MLSTKNALVLVLAMCFALYQFNKHNSKMNVQSGKYQLEQTKKMLFNTIDMFKYEIVQGTNNRENELLFILSRDGKDHGKDNGHSRPIVVAEIVADKRMERKGRYNKRRHGPKHGTGRHQHKRRSSSRSKGGYGGGGGRRNGQGRHGGRGRSGDRRQRDRMPFYDGPPLLRLTVYDEAMVGLQDLLERSGFINPVPKDGQTQLPGGGASVNAGAVGGVGNGNGAGNGGGSGSAASTRTKEQEEEMKKQELIKRERKEAQTKSEQNVKTKEEASKHNEEKRKASKKLQEKEKQQMKVDQNEEL